jgi:CDP-diacylglycerol--glycerol-3-phosphate 3-phosphatidyltransferase
MSETKRAYSHLLNAPNLLTFSRVILAVAFFIVIPPEESGASGALWYLIALAIFLLAVVTDWLDGYVARKYHMETALGRIADPFVDKVLVCGGFIILAIYLKGGPYMSSPHGLVNIAPWMVVIVTAREFLISALRGFAESMDIRFGANVWGKQKMVIQSVAICAILAQHSFFYGYAAFAWFTTALIWLAVAWTILSGVLYISRAKRVLKNEPA